MARKLALPPGEVNELELKYLWCDVYYTTEDGNLTSLSILSQRSLAHWFLLYMYRGWLCNLHFATRKQFRSSTPPLFTFNPHFKPFHRFPIFHPSLFLLLLPFERSPSPSPRSTSNRFRLSLFRIEPFIPLRKGGEQGYEIWYFDAFGIELGDVAESRSGECQEWENGEEWEKSEK